MTTYVAFLRGVNVGGNKTIRMAALKALVESLGFSGVRTLLNSGNVVFSAGETGAGRLAKTLEDAIEKEFGFRVVVVPRTAGELRKILAGNPFPEMEKEDPSHLLVMTLVERPPAGAKKRLAEVYSGPEEIEVTGRDVYLTYPKGIGVSKLTPSLLEKHVGVGTARNWNTLTKLLAIVDQTGR